jgi:hypothetical protein
MPEIQNVREILGMRTVHQSRAVILPKGDFEPGDKVIFEKTTAHEIIIRKNQTIDGAKS